MADKQIAYKSFILNYATYNGEPCHYINVLDQALINPNVDIDSLMKMLDTINDNIIANVDNLVTNMKSLIDGIKRIKKPSQAFTISKALTKQFQRFLNACFELKQIKSIKITTQNNPANNLEEVTLIINKLDSHKKGLEESINKGHDLFINFFKESSDKISMLNQEKKVELVKTFTPIANALITNKKNPDNTIIQQEGIMSDLTDLIFKAGIVTAKSIGTVFKTAQNYFISITTFGVLFDLINMYFNGLKSGFFYNVVTVICELLLLNPATQGFLKIVGTAVTLTICMLLIFTLTTLGWMIYNHIYDTSQKKENKELDEKLTQISNKTNLSFKPAQKTETNFTTIEPQTLDTTSINTNNNSNDIFGGFNNTGGFNPTFDSKPNDKYGIGL